MRMSPLRGMPRFIAVWASLTPGWSSQCRGQKLARGSWEKGMARPALELHPDAVTEASAAREWYAARSQSAAARFVAELDHAVYHSRAALASVTASGWSSSAG